MKHFIQEKFIFTFMRKKKALITGISGQDAAYLSNFLLKKNYIVVGGERKKNKSNLWRLKALRYS